MGGEQTQGPDPFVLQLMKRLQVTPLPSNRAVGVKGVIPGGEQDPGMVQDIPEAAQGSIGRYDPLPPEWDLLHGELGRGGRFLNRFTAPEGQSWPRTPSYVPPSDVPAPLMPNAPLPQPDFSPPGSARAMPVSDTGQQAVPQQQDAYASIMQSMRRDFPLIRDIPFSVGRGTGPYESEVYQPWDKENPTPNQFHIELRHYLDQPRSQDDIRRLLTGEMFHHLGTIDPRTGQPVNPQWYQLKQEVINQMDPRDFANAQRNYVEAVKNDGETRSFGQWMQESAIDQFIGGTMFPLSNESEWVQRARALPHYNPQQSAVIEQMRHLLTRQDQNNGR